MIAKDVLMTFEQIWWVNYKEKKVHPAIVSCKAITYSLSKNT